MSLTNTVINYREKLHSLIPGGCHTYSRGDDQYPSNAPVILSHGKGAYVWDAEGNRFLDYGMSLRAVTLGYADEQVNQAAFQQMQNGVQLTRPSLIELAAAETMVELMPGLDMVKFAKNGSNVTTAAVKIARAFTGKKYVAFPKEHPFFSFDDWFIGTTEMDKGVPEEYKTLSLTFNYNNIESLSNLFDQYPNQIACVILEPTTIIHPCQNHCDKVLTEISPCHKCPNHFKNFLQQVKQLCHKNGALLILDEMGTAFRWKMPAAYTYFNVEPDIATFGKGLANGYSVAAMVGKREFFEIAGINKPGTERTFLLSTTHGAEMPSLAAFMETAKIFKEKKVISHLWNYGEKLFKGINDISKKLGIEDYFNIIGTYIQMGYVSLDKDKKPSMNFRTLFQQEMIRNKIIMPYINYSYAHTQTELDMTLEAVEKALLVYKKALEQGIEHYLEGPCIKPVFRKYN